MSHQTLSEDLHQEEDNVPPGRVLVAFCAIIVVSGVLIAWALSLVAQRMSHLRPTGFPESHFDHRRMVSRVQEDLFEGPGLGQALNDEEQRTLASYGWLDRSRGLVRVPIAQAMKLYAGKGQPGEAGR